MSVSHFCFLKFIYLFLSVLDLHCFFFSSRGKPGLLSSGARASHFCEVSCCGPWALGHVDSVVVASGL